MFSSLKKWVQDKAVDLTPPPISSQPSPSFSKSESSQQYYFPTRPSYEQQQYNERLSSNSTTSPKSLSRPISMDSVRSSRMVHTPIPPPLASPGELDLSHLNREEQEHIANVLKRARAIDEQQQPQAQAQQQHQTSIPAVVVSSKQSPPASILSASLSPSASLSSSTSTSSFHSEKPESYDQNDKNDNYDDNEIRLKEELPTSPLPESTLTTIYRCQVCNKEQQPQEQGNTTICFQCQNDEEIARVTQNNILPFKPIRKSSSPIQMESIDHEDDQISDINVRRIDQKLIKTNSSIEENPSSSFSIFDNSKEKMTDYHDDDDQQQEEHEHEEEKQVRQSPPIPSVSSLRKTRTNNLTEIDEDDFFYQGPSPYAITMDNNEKNDESSLLTYKIDQLPVPTYKIDEYVDEDDKDERDHVKELEETIANISRHFPISSDQLNDIEINSTETSLNQPKTLAVDKIDIDSILEMEIESPSTDEHFIQSSTSMHPPALTNKHPHTITTTTTTMTTTTPISIPISVNNRRGSLSRSSGVRENLTDLLTPSTTTNKIESYPADNQLLQRTSSIHSKRVIPIHRQRRNLPSVPPPMMNNLELRRTNSESRFSLPAVPPSIIISNSNLDDESDLLEIDLNDPTGSMKRTLRSKTESEIPNSNHNDQNLNMKLFNSSNPSPSVDDLSLSNKKQPKQLRDQTTNTPPISSLQSTNKIKKKLKKKTSSSPPNHMNSSTHTDSQITLDSISPTRTNPPPSSLTGTNQNRAKLQKSTSTEISYPFPVLKLILSRANLNPSRRDGTDLGLRITGGHSIPYCMEVAARIEFIDRHHKNYNILKNAVQEGDEVLEAGGVSLRGKSGLFVENLMKSIENEFELVIRSQHILPSNEISSTNNKSQNTLTVIDSNMQRRHSMDTSELNPINSTNNTVVKSHSTIMPLPANEPTNVSEQLLSPTIVRKKSVSSKERLFSVESLHRTASIKSNENLINTNPPSSPGYQRRPSIKSDEQKPITISVNTPDETIQRRRLYEHRNSLLPNDPGLNGLGPNSSMDRRNSNESDESDNLSQYFRSTSSRKSSLMATTDLTHIQNMNTSQQRSPSVTTPHDDDPAADASRRLQKFLKSSDQKRSSTGSTGDESINLNKNSDRKSTSTLGSFKFLKKKTKSVDFSNQPTEIREDDYVGDIQLQIGHVSEREQLVIRIIQAKNLLAKDTNGYSDPFVKVYLLPGRDQENKRRTKHISKNLNPVWDQTVVYGNMHREEAQYKKLEVTVWDYDRFKANDFLGQVTIDLKDPNVIDDKPHWYRLQALRSREETTNRGSSPRLFNTVSVDSTAASSSLTMNNKTTGNTQSRTKQRK